MEQYDVTVIGAGLAGLYTARLLAESGLHVLLADRKAHVGDAVHTTGIFVRKTLEDFELPADCLGPAIRDVTLYSPKRHALALCSPHDEFRVGRMALLYERLLQKCVCAGVEWMPNARYEGHRIENGKSTLRLNRHGRVEVFATRYVVGADGATSRVAEDLRLSQNHEWIVGVEEIFDGLPLTGPPQLHCFLDPRLAPGYIAWVVNDGEEIHLGVGGYADRFDPARALNTFRNSLEPTFDFSKARLVDRRGGRIPVNGLLPHLANEHGLLVGDAAGAVSPLTAGGFDGCLRLSKLATLVIEEFLRTGDANALQAYSGGAFRSRFVSRLWMRRIIAHSLHPALLELGCAILRFPILRMLAWQVFFGRASFPDVNLTRTQRPNYQMRIDESQTAWR